MMDGRRIRRVRLMAPEELMEEGWSHTATVPCIEMEDGSILYASCDEEGNGPGAIFGQVVDEHGKMISIMLVCKEMVSDSVN